MTNEKTININACVIVFGGFLFLAVVLGFIFTANKNEGPKFYAALMAGLPFVFTLIGYATALTGLIALVGACVSSQRNAPAIGVTLLLVLVGLAILTQGWPATLAAAGVGITLLALPARTNGPA